VRHDKRLHNTKLLLKHDNIMKNHCNNFINKLYQIIHGGKDENAIDIESIKHSVSRTYLIIKHIANMLDLYESYCKKSNKSEGQRKYRVARVFYIDDVKPDDSLYSLRENVWRSRKFRNRSKAYGNSTH